MKMIKKRKSEQKDVTGGEAVPTNKKQMRKGAFNLVLLGVGSILAACITTGVSLLVYHNSGDIYLDWSRPGFLPEEEGSSEDTEEEYEFDKTGAITKEVLEEYLTNLEAEVKALDNYKDPFSAEALSDERLGIPGEM